LEIADPGWLKNVPQFEGLTDDQLVKIASWLEVEEFQPNHFPAREDAHGYVFYILNEGRVRVEHHGRVVDTLEPPAVFGEMAFFAPDSHRSATIVPETPIRVLTMFGTEFRKMLAEMPEVSTRLHELANERLARDLAADQSE
jgi:CRP-like cAMP-binding protein